VIIIIFLMCVALVWIGGIFYAMRKGLNEIISGLSSIDERLARLENNPIAPRDAPASLPPV
jgi:hypothetical protein